MTTAQELFEVFKGLEKEILDDIILLASKDSSSFEEENLHSCGETLIILIRERLGIEPKKELRATFENSFDYYYELGESKRSVLFLCHYDTVWKQGSPLPIHIEDGKLYGPGVLDMKGGLILMIWILKVLKERNLLPEIKIRILLVSDEETGSKATREYTKEAATGVEACFVFEPGRPDGSIITTRKGCSEYRLEIHGRSSHCGSAPLDGIDANEELAHQILKIKSFNDYERGSTFNPGVVSGGDRGCMISDHATIIINTRNLTKAGAEYIDRSLRSLVPVVEGVQLQLFGKIDRLALVETPESMALYTKLRKCASEIGVELGKAMTGGTSDGNDVSAMGIPVLDGLGAVGDGAHSLTEHLDIDSVAKRAAIFAGFFAEYK
ncbi:MAG: M20/M25/M40 family metallo-hydrolase [Spirochaetales bacterium]|nr:M20/M25/M40 family metallo-hydrolase [Spirochaetales bacterium]